MVPRFLLLLGMLLLALVTLNVAVRKLGGDVPLFAYERAGDRLTALRLLAWHWALGEDHPDTDVPGVLRDAALRHGVSASLVLEVARAESSLIHTRISGTGAMGLMQLMPDTARELRVSDPFDACQNADGGVRYLKQLLVSYRGDVRRALAAYNAGPGRVPARGRLLNLPRETRSYVARIVSAL